MSQYRHVIEVEARFVDKLSDGAGTASEAIDDVSEAAKDAAKALNDLDKKKVAPKVNHDRLLSELDKTERKLKKLTGKDHSIVMLLKDKATATLSKLAGKASAFAHKTYTAAVNIKDTGAYRALSKISNMGETIAGKTWRAGVKIIDYATGPIRAIKNSLFSLRTLAAGIFAGIATQKAILSPIATADAYTGARSGFQNLLGDSGGQKMMDDLDAFALKTPFKTAGVIENAQKMLAMGWDTDTLIEDMETLGNAAAATGKMDTGLESIVRAMAQIKTKGRLSTEELNQLAEAGIAAKAMLAEGLGYGTGDEGIAAMTKDLEDGAIASGEAIDALLKGMKKYDGMMDAMANEQASGLKDQIADAFEVSVVRKWGQGLQDGAKRGLGTVVGLLDDARGALDEFGDTLYEIGKTASNWVADKFQNAISRILEITDSFEFKNASLGEKVSMLWKGVITDPLKEWWEGGGREKTAETAEKVGAWMGETLSKGLLAIFGMTDILKDSELDAEGGASIAQSFARGFVDNFDVSAITDKLVDAIKNVWGALPPWAKVLLGVYGGSKLAIGGANLFSSIGTLIGTSGTTVGGNVVGAAGLLGLIGKTGQYGVGASGILGGLSKLGYGTVGMFGTAGKAATLGMTGGTAAAAGAGALAMGAGAIHIGKSTYDSISAFRAGDDITGKAEAARALSTGAGMASGVGIGAGIAAAGAKVGAAIGTTVGPLGTIAGALIGGGVGALVGWVAGDKIAKNIEAGRVESEELQKVLKDNKATSEDIAEAWAKAKYENAAEHFGDIKLSMQEIESLTKRIVWGADLTSFEKFSSATMAAEASLESFKTAAESTNRWMWKASLGVKFDEDERESIIASFDEYISSAKAFVENKHYEFTTSASILLDLESKEGKSILESGNAYYESIQKQLENLGSDLSHEVNIALEDGVITLNEQKEITNLQKQIAEITSKLADAEAAAEIELIKVKFGNGNLDIDSFDSFMTTMETTLNDRMSAADEAFKVQVANLKLRFPNGGEQYEKELKTLIEGYETKVESIKAEVMDVELGIIGDAYEDVLGSDAKAKLTKGLEKAIQDGIDSTEFKGLSDKQLAKLLGLDENAFEGKGETAANIREMLSSVLGQIEIIEVDGKVLLNIGGVEVKEEENTEKKVESVVRKTVPESLDDTIVLNLTAEKNIDKNINILAEEFGIPASKAETILWKLSSAKTIQDQVEIIAKEFGINESEAATVLWKLSGTKRVTPISIFSSDFGIKSSYTFNPVLNINPKKGNVTSPAWAKSLDGDSFRGGIWYPRGVNAKGYADGGIVSGGARLITVAEEGTPEMIIPLGSHRRERGLELWEKTGEMLGVNRYDQSPMITGKGDQGIRNNVAPTTSSNSVKIELGGVNVTIQVDASGSANVAEAIKAQSGEIAETVAGMLADELAAQFANTPAKGGAA